MTELQNIEADAVKYKWWIIGAGGLLGAYVLYKNSLNSSAAAAAAANSTSTAASGPDDAVQEASLAAQVQSQGIQAQASEVATQYGAEAAAAEQSSTDALQATIAGDQAAIQAAALQAQVAEGQTGASVTENEQNQETNQAQISAQVSSQALSDSTQVQLSQIQSSAILGALGIQSANASSAAAQQANVTAAQSYFNAISAGGSNPVGTGNAVLSSLPATVQAKISPLAAQLNAEVNYGNEGSTAAFNAASVTAQQTAAAAEAGVLAQIAAGG